MGRPPAAETKNQNRTTCSKDLKGLKRKRHQRKLEAAVKLDEFLTAEAKQAGAANPGGDASFLYQNTQAKIFGKQFDRVAERLNLQAPLSICHVFSSICHVFPVTYRAAEMAALQLVK